MLTAEYAARLSARLHVHPVDDFCDRTTEVCNGCRHMQADKGANTCKQTCLHMSVKTHLFSNAERLSIVVSEHFTESLSVLILPLTDLQERKQHLQLEQHLLLVRICRYISACTLHRSISNASTSFVRAFTVQNSKRDSQVKVSSKSHINVRR